MKLIKQGALDTRVATDGTGESKEDNEDNAAKRSARSQLFEKLVLVKLDAFKFKSVAFQEEREYRLLATSQTNDTPVRREHLQYRAANERILAYATLAMVETGASQISEIVLGPKHATPCEVIEEFLELNGFLNVAVRRSSASYR